MDMDWLKRLFSFAEFAEDEENHSAPVNDSEPKQKDIRAKIAYYYPKTDSQVPLVKTPGERKRRKSLRRSDIQGKSWNGKMGNHYVIGKERNLYNPTEKRIRRKPVSRSKKLDISAADVRREDYHKPVHGENIEKVNFKPVRTFQPTEVPSPVFGHKKGNNQQDIVEFELTSFEDDIDMSEPGKEEVMPDEKAEFFFSDSPAVVKDVEENADESGMIHLNGTEKAVSVDKENRDNTSSLRTVQPKEQEKEMPLSAETNLKIKMKKHPRKMYLKIRMRPNLEKIRFRTLKNSLRRNDKKETIRKNGRFRIMAANIFLLTSMLKKTRKFIKIGWKPLRPLKVNRFPPCKDYLLPPRHSETSGFTITMNNGLMNKSNFE